MKLKDGFIMRQVAGENVVIPSGDQMDLNKMITLNGTGAFLWKLLETETTQEALVEALLGEYDVDRQTVAKSVAEFMQKLDGHGISA